MYQGLVTWRFGGGLAALAALLSLGCGGMEQRPTSESKRSASASATPGGSASDATAAQPRLAHDDSDQVMGTLVVPFGQASTALTDDDGVQHWVVDMQAEEPIKGGVAPDKYLRLKGDLQVPAAAENRRYAIGCLFVDLKDNVYYRERTWLRLATRGIRGQTYREVKLPLTVDRGNWQTVPDLDGSITLQEFAANTIKSFHGTLCFQLDFSNAPAQQYAGEVIVQYLRPGEGPNPPACASNDRSGACSPKPSCGDHDYDQATPPPPAAPAQLACGNAPVALKAKQQASIWWTMDGATPTKAPLSTGLTADQSGSTTNLGTLVRQADGKYLYTAPSSVAANMRVLATARATGTEELPVNCQIDLIADDQLGVSDDGEVQGLPGNVYKLPPNTAKLPNLDQLQAIDHIVMSNIDVPNRDFSAGFPKVKDLVEWFAIRLHGRLHVETGGSCAFKLTADDGAILTIDGNEVVNNDGLHPVQDKTGVATLTAGDHDLRVDYYQGPRWYIALQLAWKCGAATEFSIIPPGAFSRPLQ